MSQRSSQKAESRASIVRSAAKLLRERGLQGMSVERAMTGAGLTVGAFYAHFESKTDLLEHAFAIALGDVEQLLRDSSADKHGEAALANAATLYLSDAHRDHAALGCPLPAMGASAIHSEDASARELSAQGLRTLTRILVDLGGHTISEERALAISALLVGTQVLARATRGTPMSSALLEAARGAAMDLIGPGSEEDRPPTASAAAPADRGTER